MNRSEGQSKETMERYIFSFTSKPFMIKTASTAVHIGKIRSTFKREPEKLGTDYVDFGFLHCVDEKSDFDEIIKNGKPDCICELKARGIVHHIGFSSHAPSVANKVIDTGLVSK